MMQQEISYQIMCETSGSFFHAIDNHMFDIDKTSPVTLNDLKDQFHHSEAIRHFDIESRRPVKDCTTLPQKRTQRKWEQRM